MQKIKNFDIIYFKIKNAKYHALLFENDMQ